VKAAAKDQGKAYKLPQPVVEPDEETSAAIAELRGAAARPSMVTELDEERSATIAELREANARPSTAPELDEETNAAIAELREANAPTAATAGRAKRPRKDPNEDDSDRLRKSTEAMVARLRENTAAAIERNKDVDYAAEAAGDKAVDYEAPPDTAEPTNATAS
jgi:hypothetical protein